MKNVKFKNLAINFCSNSTFFASEIIRFLWGGLLNSVLELDMKAPVRSLLQLFSNIHQIHNFHFDEKANTLKDWSVILIETSCKDGNIRFTTVPLKP